MGLAMFVKSGIFYPQDYGLNEGDEIDIVLVGAGGYGFRTANEQPLGYGAGDDSSFGTDLVARSAYGDRGGVGGHYSSGYASYVVIVPAGGAGGYVPGAPFQGGPGAAPPKTQAGCAVVLRGNGGGGVSNGHNYSNTQYAQGTVAMGGAGSCFGGGNSTDGEGGAGYGAGGAAGASSATTITTAGTPFRGGFGGEIKYHTKVLTAEDVANGIPVTIGSGAVYLGSMLNYAAKKINSAGSETNLPTLVNASWQSVRDIAAYRDAMLSLSTLKQAVRLNSTYSIRPFCSYPDGTNFLAYSTVRLGASTAVIGGYFVYSPTANAVFPSNACFPKFESPWSNGKYIYRVGNYFVQQQTYGSGSGTDNYVTFRYILASKALSGTATSADVHTVKWLRPGNSTGVFPFGFDVNGGLICLTAQNQYAYWTNWTPESDMTEYTTVTATGNIGAYNQTAYRFLPYKTGAVLCGPGASLDSSALANTYISNVPAGTLSTTALYIYSILGHAGDYQHMYRSQARTFSTGTFYYIGCLNLETNPRVSGTTGTLDWYAYLKFGNAWKSVVTCQVNVPASYSFNSDSNPFIACVLWPTADGGWLNLYSVTTVTSNLTLPYISFDAQTVGVLAHMNVLVGNLPYGYDNHGGQPAGTINTIYGHDSCAGGAGGCCQITW